MSELKNKNFVSASESETEAIGAEIARMCPRGSVILLDGDLGAGKTVFTRGFARALGIDEPVSSPTYTIVQEYDLPERGRLYHLDLYRISGVQAALAFGVDEFLNDPSSFALVELFCKLKADLFGFLGRVCVVNHIKDLRLLILSNPTFCRRARNQVYSRIPPRVRGALLRLFHPQKLPAKAYFSAYFQGP